MPIWLRNLTFNLINDHYEKRAEAQKKSTLTNNSPKDVPKGPGIRRSDYTAKAPK